MALNLRGHGLRERDLTDVSQVQGEAEQLVVKLRRYRCRPCGAVVMVLPRGVLPRCRFTAAAMAVALALWSHAAHSARAVRERLLPRVQVGYEAGARWISLRRWGPMVAQWWQGLRVPQRPGLVGRAFASALVPVIAARAPLPSGSLLIDVMNAAAHAP